MPSKPRIYLDSCAISRPFDDQSQPRIFLETQSLLVLIGMINRKTIELVSSDVLEYESNINPYSARRNWVQFVLDMATLKQPFTDAIQARADVLSKLGLKQVDALHAASAEAANVSFIVTSDDRFAKRYRGPVSIVRPETLVMKQITSP